MKKIIFSVCFLFMAQFMVNLTAVADEIVDSTGNITPCKVETIMGGLVEYKKLGNLHYFERSEDQPVFNDYVDVRTHLLKSDSIERYTGKILFKDEWNVRLRNEKGDMDVPFYRVKFIGVYKP